MEGNGAAREAEPILLAEDNRGDVLLIRRSLRRLDCGHRLQVVHDGYALIRYLQGEGAYRDRERFAWPRLIFLDLGLPRGSAFAALQWIRSQRNLRYLPVVALTTSVFDPAIPYAYQLGVNSFLTKPEDFSGSLASLRDVLEFWLEGEQPLRQAA